MSDTVNGDFRDTNLVAKVNGLGRPPTLVCVSKAYADAVLVEMARMADAAREARQLTAAIVAGEAKFRALAAKLHNQAAYAVWRQDVVKPSQLVGKRRKSDGIAEPRSHRAGIVEPRSPTLPATDPGKDVIARWRDGPS